MKKIYFTRHLIILIMCVACVGLLMIPNTVSATTIEVSTIGELESAINDDECSTIVIKKSIQFTNNTVINGEGKTVTAEVTGTNDQGIVQTGSNYSIFSISSGAIVTINNLKIKGGSTTAVVNDGTLYLNNVKITNSGSATVPGGAIINNKGGYVVMKDSSLERNVALNGGGFKNFCGTFIFDNCSIVENRSIGSGSNGGGGGENTGNGQESSGTPDAKLYMYNCTIANNSSSEIGGGINNCKKGYVYLMNCTVAGNATTDTTTGFGGGIGNNDSYLSAVNCLLVDNVSVGTTTSGSDIGVYNSSTTELIDCMYKSFSVSSSSTTPTTTNCQQLASDEEVFAVTIEGAVISANGTQGTVTFQQPALVSDENDNLLVAVKKDSKVIKDEFYTYFDYSDLSNIVMAYKETSTSTIKAFANSDITNVTTVDNKEISYGTNYILKDGESIITIKILKNSDFSIDGGTIFGDSYIISVGVGKQLSLVAKQTSTSTTGKGIFWYNYETGEFLSSSSTFNLTATQNMIITTTTFAISAARGDRQVTLSWPVTSEVEDYKVYYSRENDFTKAFLCTDTANSNGIVVKNLTSGSLYYFWVCPVIDGIEGDPATASATTRNLSNTLTVSKIEVTTQPKLNYVEGQKLDLEDMFITVTFTNKTIEKIGFIDFATKGVSLNQANGNTLVLDNDKTQIIATYKGYQATTEKINVIEKVINGIEIKQNPQLNYIEYDQLDLTNLIVYITYNDDTKEEIAYNKFLSNGITTNYQNGQVLKAKDDQQNIVVTFSLFTCLTDELNVEEMTLDSINIKTQPKLTYIEDQELDLTNLVVTLNYNGRTKDVAFADFNEFNIETSITNGTSLPIINDPVTISCKTKEAQTNNLNISKKIVTNIQIKTQPKTSYIDTEPLDLSSMVATLTYNNGKTADINFDEFEANSIATSISNETIINKADANTKITVSCNGYSDETDAITVQDRVLTGISIKTQPRLTYIASQKLDLSEMVVLLSYNYGTEEITYLDFETLQVNATIKHNDTLGVWYNGSYIYLYYKAFNTHTDALSVAEKEITKIEVKTQPKLYYASGENIDLSGLVITVTFNDIIEEDYTYSNMTSIGIQPSVWSGTQMLIDSTYNGKPITISKGEIKGQTNNILVVKKAITNIAIKTQPTLNYVEGQNLNLSGLVITVTYTDETEEDMTIDNFLDNGITISCENGKTLSLSNNGDIIEISCNGHIALIDKINVVEKKVINTIILTQPGLSYVEGQKLDLSSLSIKLIYNDNTSKTILFSQFTDYNIDTDKKQNDILSLSDDKAKITITCNDVITYTEGLSVIEKVVVAISIKTQPTLNYIEGQQLNLNGLVVALTYNDNEVKNVSFSQFTIYGITLDRTNGEILLKNDNSKIKVIYNDLNTLTNSLNVREKQVTNISIKAQPKLTYVEQQKLDLTQLAITIYYDNGTSLDMNYIDFIGVTLSKNQNDILSLADNGQKITISYAGLEVETNELAISSKEVASISIKTQPKLTYVEEQALDLTSMVVTITYNNGINIDVPFIDFASYLIEVDKTNATILNILDNNTSIKVTCDDKTAYSSLLNVSKKVVTNISIKVQPTLSYIEGQKLDLTNLIVTLSYNNGKTKDVLFDNFEENDITIDLINETVLTLEDTNKQITISCNSKTTKTEKISVEEKAVEMIQINKQPTLNYIEGQQLNLNSLSVILTYNDLSTTTVDFASFITYEISTSIANETLLSLLDNEKEIVISCQGKNVSTAKLKITAKTIQSITVKTQPTLNYIEGQSLNLSNLIIILQYNNGTEQEVEYADFASYEITTSLAQGQVLAIANNNATITITCNGKSAQTNSIKVSSKIVTQITINVNPKLTYIEEQNLDLTNLIVTLTYNDGSKRNISYVNFISEEIETNIASGTKLSVTDNESKILVTYKELSVETNALEVSQKQINSISIKTQPKLNYYEGQLLDLSSLVITVTYNNETTNELTYESVTTSMLNGCVLTLEDNKTIKVTYQGKEAFTDSLVIIAKEITSISIKVQPKLNYIEGQHLDLTNLILKLVYNDGTNEEVNYSSFTGTTSFLQNQALTLTNNNQKIRIEINSLYVDSNNLVVIERKVTSISIKTQPKLNYIEGQTLDLTNLLVTLIYNDNSSEDVDYLQVITSMTHGTILKTTDDQTLLVSYNDLSIETDALTVLAKAVTKITIEEQPKLNYIEGQSLNLNSLVIKVYYNDETTKNIAYIDFDTQTTSLNHGDILTIENNEKITVTYIGKEAQTNSLTVVPKEVSSIEVKVQPHLSYVEGQTLDLSIIEVLLTYNDGSTKQIAKSQFTAYGVTLLQEERVLELTDNGMTIGVSCNGHIGYTDSIVVTTRTIESITIITNPKLNYIDGQQLDLSSISVKLSYNDSTFETYGFDDFADKEITTSILNGTKLSMEDNNVTIKVAFDDFYVYTNPIIMTNKVVTDVDVKTQPKLNYIEGQQLDLSDLEVTLTYNDGDTVDVLYEDFGSFITIEKAHGYTLSLTDSGTIKITCNEKEAYTNALNITALDVTNIAVKTQPKLNYIEGQQLDLTNLIVTLTYNDGTTKDVKYADFNILTTSKAHGKNLTLADSEAIIVSYNSITTNTSALSVIQKVVSKIEVQTQPKLNYIEGQQLNLSALVIKVTYNDGDTTTVDYTKVTSTISHGTILEINDNRKIGITYASQYVETDQLTIENRFVTSITVKTQPKLNYIEGQQLDLSSLVITATYNDETTEDITYENVTTSKANGLVLSMLDNQTITITYEGKTTNTNTLVVSKKIVTNITIKVQPKLNYIEGQQLDLTALVVTLTYNDTSTKDVKFADFQDIETSKANGIVLSMLDNQTIKVTCQSIDAYTNTLVIIEKVVTNISLASDLSKLTYIEGQTISLEGLVVTLTYNDLSTENVPLASFGEKNILVESKSLLTMADNQTRVKISYDDMNIYTSEINILSKEVSKIEVKTQPKLNYIEGQQLDLSSLVITATYNDETTEDITYENVTTSKANGLVLSMLDNQTITITYEGKTTNTNTLVVSKKIVTNITIKVQPKLSYIEGQQLDLTALVVTLTYNDTSTKDVEFADFQDIETSKANGIVLSMLDNQTIKVTCQSIDAYTNTLEIEEIAVSNIAIKTQPKLNYIEGQSLNLNGLEIILTYNNGNTKEVSYYEFSTYQIDVDIENKILQLIDNGKEITITCQEKTIKTSSLIIIEKKATEINVKTQPKLNYVQSENLDLSKLIITITYNDNTTKHVAFNEFETLGIDVSIAHGSTLLITQNNVKIVISLGLIKAQTNKLYITEKKQIEINDEQQSYKYDSTKKTFKIDSELTFVVKYYQENSWTIEIEPINAQRYNILISRAEDDEYETFEKKLENGLIITLASISYEANGYIGVYDGEYHNVSIIANASIEFSLDLESYSSTVPTFKNCTNGITVYYRIKKDNYETVLGSVLVQIAKKNITITANNITVLPTEEKELTYSLSSEPYDEIIGSLACSKTNSPGKYQITQGTLAINNNYQINFIEGTYCILATKINMRSNTVSGYISIPQGIDPLASLIISKIDVSTCDIETGKNKEKLAAYEFILTLDGKRLSVEGMEVFLQIDEELLDKDLFVLTKENDQVKNVDVVLDENILSFKTNNLGKILIITNKTTMDAKKNSVLCILIILLVIVNGLELTLGGFIFMKIRRLNRVKQFKTCSFVPLLFSATTINNGAYVAVVILAIFAIIQSLALAYGCYLVLYKKKEKPVMVDASERIESKPVIMPKLKKETKDEHKKEKPIIKPYVSDIEKEEKKEIEPAVSEVNKETKPAKKVIEKSSKEKPKKVETKPQTKKAKQDKAENKVDYSAILASVAQERKKPESKYSHYVVEEEPVKKKRSNAFVQGSKTDK